MNKMVTKMRGALALNRDEAPVLHTVPDPRIKLGHYRWVLVLTALVSIYYAFFASDVYETTARVYIKATDSAAPTIPGLQILAPVSAETREAGLVNAYFSSLDFFNILEKELEVSEHFSDERWDLYSRLPTETTIETRFKYFKKRLKSSLNPDDGILTIRGQGYTSEFSLKIVKAALASAEDFVNAVGQNIAVQEMAFVDKELARTRGGLDTALAELLNFQTQNGILNTEAGGASLQQLVAELEGELARTKTTERQKATFQTDSAPELIQLRERIVALEAQIKDERAKLANRGDKSFSELNAKSLQLENNVAFNQDLYTAARLSMERARIESFKKLKHLVVIQSPQQPEQAARPTKLYNIATLFIALSLAYGIIVMIIATIREHRDV